MTPEGQRIITGSRDGTARVWDANDGVALVVLRGNAGQVQSIAVTPDGTQVVATQWMELFELGMQKTQGFGNYFLLVENG